MQGTPVEITDKAKSTLFFIKESHGIEEERVGGQRDLKGGMPA